MRQVRRSDGRERYFSKGGGSIFTFEVKGGQDEAWRFIDNLQIFSLLANVADVKSLVIHPATTTHSQLSEEELLAGGIKPNTIVLGLITTKSPTLEDKEAVIARIHEAAQIIPLDRLYLSPQCGFASCEIGHRQAGECPSPAYLLMKYRESVNAHHLAFHIYSSWK